MFFNIGPVYSDFDESHANHIFRKNTRTNEKRSYMNTSNNFILIKIRSVTQGSSIVGKELN